MRVPVLTLLSSALLLNCAQYPLGPDSQPQSSAPKGTVTKAVLAPGKYFPGTPHKYAVYFPAQYQGSKPTPVMIFLDGSGFLNDSVRAQVVFDNLIAKHDLPPMIGIFVDPGVLPALSDAAQSRYERVFEYDSLSDRYSRFLLEELIPEVAKKYNLSTDPNDRALCGVSTGAVGAFMAAWNRPDQFHRVLSFIGTYVAMKGADELPALIRKTEPKPIRIYLQDGHNDHIVPNEPYGTFYAGSWPINNQVMYEAFQFSGYDVKLELGEEGHNMKQGAAILPDALRWLWREYPNPIVVHEPEAMTKPGWDPRGKVYSTVWSDKPWQPVMGDYREAGNPTGDKNGNVYFADSTTNRIYKADAEGKLAVFKEHANGTRLLRAAPGDRLFAWQAAHKRIVSYAADGTEKPVAQNIPTASDMVVTAKGAIYFTDGERRTVNFVDSTGHARVVYQGDEIAAPSGLALSPDQAMLIVTDSAARFSWSFQIAADGSLSNGEPFYRLELPESGTRSDVSGAGEDASGMVYFATPTGIQICEANGRLAEVLNPPEHGGVTSLAFAGPNFEWLYATENGKLFRRPVKVRGVAVDSPQMPPKPPL